MLKLTYNCPVNLLAESLKPPVFTQSAKQSPCLLEFAQRFVPKTENPPREHLSVWYISQSVYSTVWTLVRFNLFVGQYSPNQVTHSLFPSYIHGVTHTKPPKRGARPRDGTRAWEAPEAHADWRVAQQRLVGGAIRHTGIHLGSAYYAIAVDAWSWETLIRRRGSISLVWWKLQPFLSNISFLFLRLPIDPSLRFSSNLVHASYFSGPYHAQITCEDTPPH